MKKRLTVLLVLVAVLIGTAIPTSAQGAMSGQLEITFKSGDRVLCMTFDRQNPAYRDGLFIPANPNVPVLTVDCNAQFDTSNIVSVKFVPFAAGQSVMAATPKELSCASGFVPGKPADKCQPAK